MACVEDWDLLSRCNIFAFRMQAARRSPKMIGNVIHQIDEIGSSAQKKQVTEKITARPTVPKFWH